MTLPNNRHYNFSSEVIVYQCFVLLYHYRGLLFKHFAAFFTIFAFMKMLFTLFSIAISVISCTSARVHTQLDLAETMLQDAPDSSLSILRRINPSKIKTKEGNARYALLLSAALDKNYIDVTSDSLIRIATDYYAISHDLRRRMMSYYYLGQVQMNSNNLHNAITCLEKAEKDAVVLQDYYYLGLILRNKSVIYNRNFNNQATIQNDLAAISAFELAKKYTHKEYASYSLAVDYYNGLKYREANAILDSLESICTDDNLLYQTRLLRAKIGLANGSDIKEIVDVFNNTPSIYLTFIDKSQLALAYEQSNQRVFSDNTLEESYAMAKSRADSATIDYIHSKIQRYRGDEADAYKLLNNALVTMDSLTRERLNSSFDRSVADYYKNEATLQEQQSRQMKERLWMMSIIGTLAIVLLCTLFLLLSREKEAQLKEYMAQFAARSAELNNAIKQNAFLIGSLFSERLYHLDELSEAYYANDNAATKEALFKEFKSKVFALRDDERLFNSLEEDLNTHCNDLMAKFREELPNVKGENIKMTILFFAGLPYKTIQIILRKNSVESLRTAKSRLRRAILEANATDSETFLKLLGSE